MAAIWWWRRKLQTDPTTSDGRVSGRAESSDVAQTSPRVVPPLDPRSIPAFDGAWTDLAAWALSPSGTQVTAVLEDRASSPGMVDRITRAIFRTADGSRVRYFPNTRVVAFGASGTALVDSGAGVGFRANVGVRDAEVMAGASGIRDHSPLPLMSEDGRRILSEFMFGPTAVPVVYDTATGRPIRRLSVADQN